MAARVLHTMLHGGMRGGRRPWRPEDILHHLLLKTLLDALLWAASAQQWAEPGPPLPAVFPQPPADPAAACGTAAVCVALTDVYRATGAQAVGKSADGWLAAAANASVCAALPLAEPAASGQPPPYCSYYGFKCCGAAAAPSDGALFEYRVLARTKFPQCAAGMPSRPSRLQATGCPEGWKS